jgi:hypothetical protein
MQSAKRLLRYTKGIRPRGLGACVGTERPAAPRKFRIEQGQDQRHRSANNPLDQETGLIAGLALGREWRRYDP